MLRLALSPQIEKFRQEFKNWIKSNPPPVIRSDTSLEHFVNVGREWQCTLSKGRWVGVHWPEAYGGRGLSLVEEAVVQEELVRANAPQILGLFGVTMVGPVLIAHGTEAQKSQFLAKILSGEEIWCQGFSEPGAGSDLAAISCNGELREGRYFINGQKVWTSFAHIADHCFLLCRTVRGSTRHNGLTYLLVPMKQSGITTRSLKQISGDEEFNEVFFDNAQTGADWVVGTPGDGWKIAISTLMYERVVLTFARQLQSEVALRGLVRRWKSGEGAQHTAALARQVAKASAVRSLAYAHLLSYSSGRSPGPEGSLDKLMWSESFQEIAKLALSFGGSDSTNIDGAKSECNEAMHRYLYSRGRTIAAGTSEIQRTIIAERLLDLPRGR